MQIDHKLLPCFDFNMESEQGQLVASVNNANQKNNQVKAVDFNLISQLLDIKVVSASNIQSTNDEEQFIQKYENDFLPAREQHDKEKDERI